MKKTICFLFVISLLLNACQGGEKDKMEEEKNLSLNGKRILMVIAPENFRDEEFQEPYTLFTNEGAQVIVASTDTTEAQGMLGMKVKPDKLLQDVNVLDFDAIVLIGGSGSPALWENEILHKHLKTAFENEKVIGAICLSPVTLVKAGLITGKTVACYKTPDVERIFRENNVMFSDETVKVIGHIVTANGPPAAKAYAKKIAELLE